MLSPGLERRSQGLQKRNCYQLFLECVLPPRLGPFGWIPPIHEEPPKPLAPGRLSRRDLTQNMQNATISSARGRESYEVLLRSRGESPMSENPRQHGMGSAENWSLAQQLGVRYAARTIPLLREGFVRPRKIRIAESSDLSSLEHNQAETATHATARPKDDLG